jgi:hypothetical protein
VQAEAPAAAQVDPDPIKFLVIGDSNSETEQWQAHFSALLTAAGIDHEIATAAVGGYRCSTWLSPPWPLLNARQTAALHQPDVVVISCGTNDAANGVTGSQMDAIYYNLMTEILIGHPPARILATWITYSVSPAWLAPAEAIVNDAIFRQTVNSVHGTRIIGTADLQQIPPGYIDGGGVHYTEAGFEAKARIVYNRLRLDAAYPWADVALPLCGMTGHRPDGSYPTYLPCTDLAQNPAS